MSSTLTVKIERAISELRRGGKLVISDINSGISVLLVASELIEKTIDRNNIWMAQTPQAFNKEKILEAYDYIKSDHLIMTDESTMMEEMGYRIKIIPGSENNFKITTVNDWRRAEMVLQ